MTNPIKKIGIMTSGGDCAGLNAVIRAVVNRAITGYGWEVVGIHDATEGLYFEPRRYQRLSLADFYGPWARLGGTMLGTSNKGNAFNYKLPDGSTKDMTKAFGEGVKALGLDAIVVIGGDGSMAIVNKMCKANNVKMIGIPKTVDLDAPFTEHTVGFASCRSIVVEALDRVQTTAASHHRVMMLEVMGRDAGFIAMHSAVAGGADICLVPEFPYKISAIVDKLHTLFKEGNDHPLMIVSEGIKDEHGQSLSVAVKEGVRYKGAGEYINQRLMAVDPSLSLRVTNLGHVQRGGMPTAQDRLVASAFGVKAVDLLAAGKSEVMVAWQANDVVDVSLEKVVSRGAASLDRNDILVKTALGLGIYIGEV